MPRGKRIGFLVLIAVIMGLSLTLMQHQSKSFAENLSNMSGYSKKLNPSHPTGDDSIGYYPRLNEEIEKSSLSTSTGTETNANQMEGSNLIIRHSEGENVVLVLASNGGGNQADIKGLLKKVIEDRTCYAKKHGYGFFFTNTNRYNTGDMHPAWLKTNAITEAMTLFPKASWFWWLDQDAIIMTSDVSIEAELLNSKSLTEKLLLHEKYIREGLQEAFTPESYDVEEVDLIFTQDHNGLNTGSMIFRRSQWTEILLDIWGNPDLAKATGFGKEQDLMRDLLVRHASLRNRAGIVEQRLINAYYEGGDKMRWHKGDLIVHFAGCWVNKKCSDWWTEMWAKRH